MKSTAPRLLPESPRRRGAFDLPGARAPDVPAERAEWQTAEKAKLTKEIEEKGRISTLTPPSRNPLQSNAKVAALASVFEPRSQTIVVQQRQHKRDGHLRAYEIAIAALERGAGYHHAGLAPFGAGARHALEKRPAVGIVERYP